MRMFARLCIDVYGYMEVRGSAYGGAWACRDVCNQGLNVDGFR